MTAEPLKQLGKYQVVDVLGEGAMGVVYRAYDQVLNRFLAIKVMSSTIVSDESLRERFLREARAAGSLQHPNVVTIYDFGEVEEHLFIAMEFVDGEDLAEIIKRREDIPLATKLDLMIDTLAGLSYAHSRGVVHRDIKPANIRVSSDTRAKVMDFGIAHLQQSDLTQSGMLVGTPQYMAPEQISGGEITPATDIFAVGTVLYEFLTYNKAFSGDTLHIILYNIMGVDPPLISQALPSAPPPLNAIVAKALAKDPKARFENAADMSKALSAVRLALGAGGGAATIALRASQNPGLPPATMRPSQIQSMIATEVAKKQRRTVVTASSVVVALAVLLIGGAWFWKTHQNSAAESPAPSVPAASSPAAAATGAVPPPVQPPSATRQPQSPPPSSRTADANRGSTAGRQGTTVAAQPDTLLISARATALSARRRALDEGATVADLAPGDAALQSAEASSAQRRSSDAIAQMVSAGTLWADAERAARSRAAAAAADRQRGSVPPPVTVQTPPPVVTPPVNQAEVPKPPVDARPEIERIIAAYGKALESTNVAEIRRAYPGLTSAQQQGWENFFKSVRNFKPTLAIDEYSVTGSNANLGIAAVYMYQNTTNGRAERQQLHLQATLSKDAGGWKIAAIK